MTAVRSRGSDRPATASRAASSSSSCCACAWPGRAAGTAGRPGRPRCRRARPGVPSPSRTARRRSVASAPSATLAPMRDDRHVAGASDCARDGPATRAPGSQASTMRWALLPPNPNALSRGPARAGPRLGVRPAAAAACRRARRSARRRASVAGRMPARIAPSTLSSPAPPAAVSRWPDVRLHRADRQVAAAGEHAGRAADLDGVADRRTGRVALEQRDRLRARRRPARRPAAWPAPAPPRPARAGRRRGRRWTARPPGSRRGPGRRPRSRRRSRMSATSTTPSPGDQPVGAAVERPAAPGRARRPQRAEALRDQQAVRPADGAGEHEVGAAVAQPVAGEPDRVQRRGAGGVEREAAAARAQRAGREVRGQPGGEPVPAVAGRATVRARPPRRSGPARRRVGQVAQDQPGARAAGRSVAGLAPAPGARRAAPSAPAGRAA